MTAPLLHETTGSLDIATLVAAPLELTLGLLLMCGVAAFYVWWKALVDRSRVQGELDDARARKRELERELEAARQQSGELDRRLNGQQSQAEQLRERSRTLERILSVAARINATHNQAELMEQVTRAVESITGFRKVILYLWSESTQAFEARAFAGIPDESKASLIGIQVSREQYDEMNASRARYSSSFLVRADDESFDFDTMPAAGATWPADLLMITPLVSRTGDLNGYFSLDDPTDGCVPDLISIRQMEFLVQQVNTAIESSIVYDRLARNNAELSDASKKLASLAEMKANFVANVSHELRTPLTSISAYTELLQQNMNSMSEDARDEFLKVINTESNKLAGIINDLLDLNRMGGDRPAMVQLETDLVQIVRHLEESWRSRAVAGDVQFRVETSADSIPLPVDSLLLQQLVGHLLSNAFKFTAAGGRVTLRLEETGTAVRLVVEDTGIGIPEDQLSDIFDQFYQVDGSATREHNGQGVGLAICQDIVTHHDGRIWAENVEPSGARFTVLLPRRPAVLQPAVRPEDGGIFEEGEFVQRLMHWISESLGVQTTTLMVPDEADEALIIRAAIGLPEAVVQSARVARGAGFAGQVWATRKTLLLADVTGDETVSVEENEPRYSTPSLLCVPLLHEDRLVGVVSVNNKIDRTPLDDDDRLFLESLAPRIAEMLDRHRRWREMTDDLKEVRTALRTTTAVGHLRHESLPAICQEICLAAGRRAGLPAGEMTDLAFALQFYDVGLSAVPRQYLNKAGGLSAAERLDMQRHVVTGLDLLAPLRPSSKVRQLILHHHENCDGSGYPDGLAGESIPLGSRLIRLADTLAALLSLRPWRPAYSLENALQQIERGAGSEYCPRLTPHFLEETRARSERIEDLQAHENQSLDRVRPLILQPVSGRSPN